MWQAHVRKGQPAVTRWAGLLGVAPVPRPCLQQIFDALNAAYFHGSCSAHIGWSRFGPAKRRTRHSMLLGSYAQHAHAIRIHPALSAPFVPDYVLRMVVFHEMLLELFGTPVVRGRRRIHPPEFVAVEQSHPDYLRARQWEQQHLTKLLRVRA